MKLSLEWNEPGHPIYALVSTFHADETWPGWIVIVVVEEEEEQWEDAVSIIIIILFLFSSHERTVSLNFLLHCHQIVSRYGRHPPPPPMRRLLRPLQVGRVNLRQLCNEQGEEDMKPVTVV